MKTTFTLRTPVVEFDNGDFTVVTKVRKYALPNIQDADKFEQALQIRLNTICYRNALANEKTARAKLNNTKATSVAVVARKAELATLEDVTCAVLAYGYDNGGFTEPTANGDYIIPTDLYTLLLYAIERKARKQGKATIDIANGYDVALVLFKVATGEMKASDARKFVKAWFNVVGQTTDDSTKQWDYNVTTTMIEEVASTITGTMNTRKLTESGMIRKSSAFDTVLEQLILAVLEKALKFDGAPTKDRNQYRLNIDADKFDIKSVK